MAASSSHRLAPHGALTVTVRRQTIVGLVAGAVIAAATMLMFANAWHVSAAPGDSDTTFVPLPAPCRLIDTRPAPARVGATASFGIAETETLQATGTNGNCTIPGDAVGLALNVTALNATTQSFLTLWPDSTRPQASSLNPSPGQPPVPNAVTVGLSSSGTFNIYNDVGSVDVIVDINGYYVQTSLKELTNRLAAVETVTAELGTATAALETAQPFIVASEPIDDVQALATATAIRQITVTAPVGGHVATVASGYIFEFTDGEVVRCGLMDSVTIPPAGVALEWRSPTGGDFTHVSASRVFDIAAGATATYSLVCNNASGGDSTISSPQLTAIFTPAQ